MASPRLGRPPSGWVATFDPMVLADDVVAAVMSHVTSMSQPIGVRTVSTGSCALRDTIVAIARYARDGESLDMPLADAVASLAILWRRVVDGDGPYMMPAPEDPDVVDASTWHGQLTRVIRAALCRETLGRGDPVSPGDLGALAGYSTRNIRNLIAAGDLVAFRDGARWMIDATSACAWLASLVLE